MPFKKRFRKSQPEAANTPRRQRKKRRNAPLGGRSSDRIHSDARQLLIVQLNQLLADSLNLGLQLKQAHWNVRGPSFLTLHEFFDESAQAVAEFTDELAERIVVMGGSADGTLATIASASRLKPYPGSLRTANRHLAVLSESFSNFGQWVRDAIRRCELAGDPGSADLCTGVSRKIDEMAWKTNAHIREENSSP